MRKVLTAMLVVLALSASAAACASGDDDENVLDETTGDDTKDGKDDKKDDTEDDDPQREASIDAIATSAQSTDPSDSDDTPMPQQMADCYAESFVDEVGVDELKGKVTPDEIREKPENDHTDWGIEVSEDQGRAIFRGILDCDPDMMREFGEAMAESMNEGGDFDQAVDPDCFADTDPDDIEDFMAAGFANGDELKPTEEQARSMIDWLDQCIDFKKAIIASIAADDSIPDSAARCLNEKIDEDTLKDFMVAGVVAGDDADIENTPEGKAFTEVITTCMLGG